MIDGLCHKLTRTRHENFYPGPWAVSNGFDGSISVSATRSFRINNISAGTPIICDIFKHKDSEHFAGEQNANLIAAAPELLDALQAMLSLDEDNHQRHAGDDDVCYEVRKAREAVAKALGHNAKVRGDAPLYGAESLSTDGLCSSAPRKGGE